MHLSFYKDDFREFVDTLVVALRGMEKAEAPIGRIHPVMLKDKALSAVEELGPDE